MANEHATAYRIPINKYASFDEMNDAEAKVMANISPLQHLQNATMLIKKVYAEQLKEQMDKRLRL